jgi:hypothetical protein
MQLTEKEMESVIALFPWVKDVDNVLTNATSFGHALSLCRQEPIRKVCDGRKLRAKKRRRHRLDHR